MTETFGRRGARLCGVAVLALAAAGCTRPPEIRPVDLKRAYIDARHTLLQAVNDSDPRIRTHALEALAAVDGEEVGPIIVQALHDERLPVVFAAAMAAGDTLCRQARDELTRLVREPRTPPKLRCAVIYALHRLGDQSHTPELARLMRDPDKFVRGTVAQVMGKMGEPAAVKLLERMKADDTDPVVQLQVVEALAELGDERNLVLLEAFTKLKYMEDRIIAVKAMGRLARQRSVFVLRKVLGEDRQEPAVRVAAAGSLAQIAGENVEGYEYALAAATDPEKVLRKFRGRGRAIEAVEITGLQTLAVLSLGHMGNLAAVNAVHPLLDSHRGAVRIAACRTILTLLRGYRPAEAAGAPAPAPATAPATTTAPATMPGLHTSGAKE